MAKKKRYRGYFFEACVGILAGSAALQISVFFFFTLTFDLTLIMLYCYANNVCALDK